MLTKELTTALVKRYRSANREDKGRILDEFTGLTGMHRKHAMRLLSGKPHSSKRRVRHRIYEEAERNALVLLWEAGDRVRLLTQIVAPYPMEKGGTNTEN